MILEVCIDSVEGALLAQKYGAKRVELCSALSVGGLTPTTSLVQKCTALNSIEVHTMLRHREGNFVYSDTDVEVMLNDLENLATYGVHGVVFGCLTAQHEIDIEKNDRLLERAKQHDLEVTFHRAFDFVSTPEKGLEQLIDMGFDRLLTSGQQTTAIEGIDLISRLTKLADGRIEIMAGSGVNASNALELASIGIDALHFTSHKVVDDDLQLGMGSKTIPDHQKIAAISTLFA